jgi:hypothetical protein
MKEPRRKNAGDTGERREQSDESATGAHQQRRVPHRKQSTLPNEANARRTTSKHTGARKHRAGRVCGHCASRNREGPQGGGLFVRDVHDEIRTENHATWTNFERIRVLVSAIE